MRRMGMATLGAGVFLALAPLQAVKAAPYDPFFKNGMASIYTFDHTAVFFGYIYGDDATYPLIGSQGEAGDDGFS